MNFAVRKGFIPANPMAKVDSHDKPGREASKRCFLTIEELKRLIETPTSHKQTRDAFLFSCFCGLRQSDIRNLKWGNLEQNNGKCYANIIVQKTGTGLYLPIGRQARDFLPPRPSGQETMNTSSASPLPIVSDVIWLPGQRMQISASTSHFTWPDTHLPLLLLPLGRTYIPRPNCWDIPI